MPRAFSLALFAALLVACSSSSVPDGGCDEKVACATGEVCVGSGLCKVSCSVLDGGPGCPDGGECTGQAPFCAGSACPAVAVLACP